VHPAIPLLLELQRSDIEIAHFRADLEAAPKRIRENEATLNTAKASVAAAKEQLAQLVGSRKKIEFEVGDWRERVKKFKSQTSAVKTNEAYKALLHEIANAENEVAKLEDSQLEQMMAVEESEKKVKMAEASLAESGQTVVAERKRIENAAREVNRKMHAEMAVREKIAAQIPEEIADRYSRLAKRHHGIALAEAVAEQCRGCGMRLLPHLFQELVRAEDRELHFCDNCGRILYASRALSYASGSGETENSPEDGRTHNGASAS
jgi:predicted  nucleic acid-binding Zn-ribbon protein